MLHLITGKSGCGKTEYLNNKLEKYLSLVSNKKIYYLVPEQYEFETEKLLLLRLGANGFSKIRVTTFTKIASEINSIYGVPKTLADDIVKKTSIYIAINEISQRLKFYMDKAKKPAFSNQILKIIDMMKASSLSPQFIAEKLISVGENNVLFNKLSDISLIFSTYEAVLEKAYTDQPDELKNAAQYGAENSYFDDMVLFVDGFDSFSTMQLDFLKTAFYSCFNGYITITCSDIVEDIPLVFYTGARLLNQLSQLESEIIYLDEIKRYKKNELVFLSENLFQGKNSTFDYESEAVSVVSCDDFYSEAEYVAAQIFHIVKKGYRYKDIAILSSDPKKYLPAFDSTFEKYGIPVFFDLPKPIIENPLTKQVISLFEVVLNPTTENILRYVKTGFVRIYDDEHQAFSTLTLYQINTLEEYAYVWNIDREMWRKPFLKLNSDGQNIFAREEELRVKICEPIFELKKKLLSKNGAEITEIITDFLINKIDIIGAVKGHCYINSLDEYTGEENETDNEKANEYHQIWELILSVFEGLHKAFENTEINLKDYYSFIKNIFSSTNCSQPPQVIDCVLFGTTGRTRTTAVKIAFIIGVNDGAFPMQISSGNTFSDYEIEEMEQNGIRLGIDRKTRYSQQILSAYKAFTLPSDFLFISYSLMDSSANSMERATEADEILEILKKQEVSANNFKEDFYSTSLFVAKQRLSRFYRSKSMEKYALSEVVFGWDKDFQENLDKVLSLQGEGSNRHNLSDPIYISRCFNQNKISATSFEQLCSCNFSFFCKNVLLARTLNKHGITPLETGNIVHFVLQKVLENHCKDESDVSSFISYKNEDLIRFIETYLEMYKERFLFDSFSDKNRFDLMLKNLKNLILPILTNLQDEFSVSRFRPHLFEAVIDEGVNDENIKPLTVRFDTDNGDKFEFKIIGKLDRLDVMKAGDKEYIRIVDYKTGKKAFDISAVKNGYNTQMLLYLFAVCQDNKFKPAGVIYYRAGRTSISSSLRKKTSDHDESLKEKAWLDSHKRSGLIVSDEEVLKEQDALNNLFIKKTSSSARKMFFDTTIRSEEELSLIKDYCENLVDEKLKEFFEGKILAVPISGKNIDPCKTCDYIAFCRKNNDKILIKDEKEIAFTKQDKDIIPQENGGDVNALD